MARGIPPQAGLDEVDQDKKKMIVSSLQDLIDMGKCETNTALRERIGMYFDLCANGSLKPGMATLRLAIGVSRTTLYDWSVGNHCDEERTEIIRRAKDVIESYLEQCFLQGQVNPVSAMFMLKVYFGYNETFNEEFKAEERALKSKNVNSLCAKDLPKLGADALRELGKPLTAKEVLKLTQESQDVLTAAELPQLGQAGIHKSPI